MWAIKHKKAAIYVLFFAFLCSSLSAQAGIIENILNTSGCEHDKGKAGPDQDPMSPPEKTASTMGHNEK